MDERESVNKQTKGEAEKAPEEIITTHVNADFDALASMIAASKLYPEATLVFPGAQEKNLRNFFLLSASYLFNFAKLKQIDLKNVKRLILVDTRQRSRIGKFAELLDDENVEIHVYDHHPESEDDIKGHLEVVRKTGSNSAILTGLIRERGIALTADEATIICLGIHEDTGSFTFSSTTSEDHGAAAWLLEQGANLNVISDLLTRELTPQQIWLLNDLTKSAVARTINGVEVVFSSVARDEYIGDFAVLVHKFMEMGNLNVVFAMAQMEDRIYVVARSRISEVNVAEIAVALGGGGHPQAASATIKNKTLIQVERSIQALLRGRINPRKRARDMMSAPVIHVSAEDSIKKAADLMTRYNINVLLVMDRTGVLKGYVTRQLLEKAVFFGLEDLKVKDYTNIEFSTVHPDAPLKEVQELIIRTKIRVLPVLEDGKVVGVITRTDLLNILVGDSPVPELLYDAKSQTHRLRHKSMAAVLKERLPRRIIELLKSFGDMADLMGYNAYLVGGLVRDVLLKRENLDVDIVIEGDGIRFAQAFAKQHQVRVRSHRKFGTAVLVFPDGFKVDVATARMEYYESPAAPPTVETSSLKLDLYRRDFTINTLAVKLNKRHYGTMIDYFGAQTDIREKVLRVLHNLSFVEDPTRVLRAVRFEQRFGFKIGTLTLALIKNAVKINCFKDLSPRRLFLELKLILKEEDPLRAIQRLNELEVLQVIAPEIEYSDKERALIEETTRVIAWYDLLYLEAKLETWKLYWHSLTSGLDPRRLRQLAKRMGMVDLECQKMLDQRERVPTLLESLFKFEGDNYGLYRLLAPYDAETVLYVMAKANSEKTRRLISLYFTKLRPTRIDLRGTDLLSMGFEPGPIFKEIMESVLEARMNETVKTKADELRFVKDRFIDAVQ
jgi:tRNA nucleotidyltransferase (CCA-adding enzyme)